MYIIKRNIFFSFFVAIIVLNPFFEGFSQQKKFKVVIDAGHGGHDSGTRGTGRMKKNEKDIALTVAKLVYKKLKKYKNIQPILTRNKDVFLELYQRAEIANKNKADVFVSIHCNANKSPRANGSETFVLGIHRNKDNLEVAKRENAVIKLEKDNHLHYEGFDPAHPESFIGLTLMQEEFLDQSIMLASLIQEEYKKNVKVIKDRSVQQAGFAVLRLTYMPSVLTEIGFLSNPKEEKLLHSKAAQEKIANSIVKAIVAYKKYIESNTPVPDLNKETSTIEEKPEETPHEEVQKQEVVTEEKPPVAHVEPTTKYENSNPSEVIFKVQLLASGKLIKLTPENFRGMRNLSVKKEGDLYKYFSGHTTNFDEIREVKAEARYKSYKNAFIVAYKNGKRIPLSEILEK